MGTYSLGPMPLGVTEGVAASGGTPPTAVVIYPTGALAAAGKFMCDMESNLITNWGILYGVADTVSGFGNTGLGYNGGGLNTYTVPPGNILTATFIVGLVNANGGTNGNTLMEVDTTDYLTNWNLGYGGGGYNDVITFAGYADGGVGATSWAWSVTIPSQSLSGGSVAYISGTASTAQDSTYVSVGGAGVGQSVFIQPGRGGYVQPGDNLMMQVDVTATNAAGSTSAASFICTIDFI